MPWIRVRMLFVALLLAVSAPGCSSPEAAVPEPGSRKVQHIGVQLYTLREQMEADFEGTLRRVAALGYKEVETAGLFGRDPEDVRALLDELGLSVPAAHVHSAAFIADPDAAIAQAAALGAEYVILAWLPPVERESLVQWEEWAAWMNDVGARAKAAGLTFAYHNHAFEFEPIDGVVPYDIILERTDPDLVSFELDFYWAALAGVDIPALVAAHPGRFVLSHVKDLEFDDQSIANVGQGDLDFATLIAASEEAGMTYFIVEHDNPTDAFGSIEQGLRYLQDLSY